MVARENNAQYIVTGDYVPSSNILSDEPLTQRYQKVYLSWECHLQLSKCYCMKLGLKAIIMIRAPRG